MIDVILLATSAMTLGMVIGAWGRRMPYFYRLGFSICGFFAFADMVVKILDLKARLRG